jgi:hypothetical protein
LINWGVVIAVLSLVVWAIGTYVGWGGWVAGALTGGVFLLVYSVVRQNKLRTANRELRK